MIHTLILFSHSERDKEIKGTEGLPDYSKLKIPASEKLKEMENINTKFFVGTEVKLQKPNPQQHFFRFFFLQLFFSPNSLQFTLQCFVKLLKFFFLKLRSWQNIGFEWLRNCQVCVGLFCGESYITCHVFTARMERSFTLTGNWKATTLGARTVSAAIFLGCLKGA